MQNLTARGIRLAAQFRTLGVPVIESYPGAAQDIMDIPRKRSGLAHLARGLRDFGVRGEFESNGVSHDELDAITSAVVGLFFWSGRFEALGNENEDYLIIPDLGVSPRDWLDRRVVGISGPIAAGKTTSARHLQERGFAYGRYSLVLEEILRERGVTVTRENLQRIGEEINNFPGQRWLSHRVANNLKDHDIIVIDGMRFPEDHATLVEQFGPAFTHVHIEASRVVRRERYRRQRSRNRVTDFDKVLEHPVEKKVAYLRRLSHIRISNEGGKNDLTRGLDQIIKTLNLPGVGC
jgi:dephospho-CoA kinase